MTWARVEFPGNCRPSYFVVKCFSDQRSVLRMPRRYKLLNETFLLNKKKVFQFSMCIYSPGASHLKVAAKPVKNVRWVTSLYYKQILSVELFSDLPFLHIQALNWLSVKLSFCI